LIVISMGVLAAGVLKRWFGGGGRFGAAHSNTFALVFGTSLGLLAIAFHSVVDFNMHIPANAVLAMTLVALLSLSLSSETEQRSFIMRTPAKVALTLLLLVGC